MPRLRLRESGSYTAALTVTDGLGTTLYTAAHDVFDPRFGPGSALAHDATGARAIAAELPRLRRDVDDLEDLDDALAMGVGPRTAERAATLG